jgi:hypothetical protein
MEQNSKKFIKWTLIYGIAFGSLTALSDWLSNKSLFILKNIFGGLVFGLVMAFLRLRSEKHKEKNDNKKN